MIVKGKEVPFVNSAVKVEINEVSAMMFARAIKQEKHFFMASETGEEAAERIVTELVKQMVAEFPEVFPDAMPTGLPPDRGRFNYCRLEKADISKSAFTCREGHFEFIVMTFGFTNAPATFQSLMTSVFSEKLGK
jgi:hypothetical protein